MKHQLVSWGSLLLLTFAAACNASSQTTNSVPGTTPDNTLVATSSAQVEGAPASPSLTPTAFPTLTPTTVPTPSPTAPPAGPVVTIGSTQFTVDVAATGQERGQGLSGRPSLAPGTGMLFVFEVPAIHQFWMGGMQFPLDFVWISDDCTVVDLTHDAPHPQPGQSPGDLPRYRPSGPVQYVLEINAGEIESVGIQTGNMVSFEGELAGKYGC